MARLALFFGYFGITLALNILYIIVLDDPSLQFIAVFNVFTFTIYLVYDFRKKEELTPRFMAISELHKAYKLFDLPKIEQLIEGYSLRKQLESDEHVSLYILSLILLKREEEILAFYNTFEYENDINRFKQIYLFELHALLHNEVDEFVQLHQEFLSTKERIKEDNIIIRPIILSRLSKKNLIFKQDILEDFYRLYEHKVNDAYILEKMPSEPMYHYLYSKLLYFYYKNTEQLQKIDDLVNNDNHLFNELEEVDVWSTSLVELHDQEKPILLTF